MDILKKALVSPNSFTFNPLKINNKEYKNKIQTPFLLKEYSSEQLVFFITNHKLSYPDYLKACKNSNILPISYVDQSVLLDYVKNYKEYSFDKEEIHLPQLDYSFINDFFIDEFSYSIIVSSAENSFINLLNINAFLREGLFVKKKVPLDYENKPIKIKSRVKKESITVTDDFNYKENKNKIIGVFLDGNTWQLKNSRYSDLSEVCENMAVFFVSEEESKFSKYTGLDVSCIKVENNKRIKRETLEFIWKKMYFYKNKK